MSKQIQIPDSWSDQLLQFPETGMGYQLVKVFLKNGMILPLHKLVNANMLLLDEKDSFELTDIEKLIPEHNL
jgi:hypothetical protein